MHKFGDIKLKWLKLNKIWRIVPWTIIFISASLKIKSVKGKRKDYKKLRKNVFTFSDPIVKEQGRMSSMSGQSPTPMSNAGQMGGGTDNTKQR